MFLRELGFALVLLLATSAYLLHSRGNKEHAVKHRKYFVAAALFVGMLVAVLDGFYVMSEGYEKLSVGSYISVTVISYAVYRIFLLVPEKIAKYARWLSVGVLSCFIFFGAYENYQQYKYITTVSICLPRSEYSGAAVTVEHETEMHRVFNLPFIDYCIDRETGEQRKLF